MQEHIKWDMIVDEVTNMILAEKIMKLRKQKGWSQEELALRLNVSRQSVSKWESMTSLPDLDKIIKLSELFGVSTDYLLKDEIEEEPGFEAYEEPEIKDEFEKKRPFSLEETNEYMGLVTHASKKIAKATMACVVCPVPLILLGGIASSSYKLWMLQRTSGAIGVAILLAIVAWAVAMFISNGMKLSKYEFLEQEPLDLEYGVEGIVKARKEEFEPRFKRSITLGVVLCIVSVIPLVVAAALEASDVVYVIMVALLLVLVAAGVYQFVWAGMIYGSFQKILEEGDYTYYNKIENKKNDNLSKVYWCITTAIYLAYSFITGNWHISWIVWPVAGVLYAAVCGIAAMIRKKR